MLSIRRITLDDVDLLKSVRLRALQDAPSAFGSTYERESKFSDSEWRSRLENWNGRRGIGFLAIEGGTAFGIAGSLLDDTDGKRAQLVSMWTAPRLRRQGLGTLLVHAVIAWARMRNVNTLCLLVTHINEGAIRFYERLGFVMTGRTEPYPNDPALTECEMAFVID